MAQLRQHQRYLAGRAHTNALELRKALYELEMADFEVTAIERKRELTLKQLKLAEDGVPGAEWPGSQEFDEVEV